MPNLKYRSDIDGMRAIAVLAVVGFHAFPGWFTGGFTGVDVFFVISGYLISMIIFEGLETGTFMLSEFYARRIRRIFPALLLVLAASYALGAITLLSDEFKQLGKHIAAGAGFVSNFILRGEAGYFDTAAETKPLLHLWSLGIEEQFYLIWPVLIVVAWARKSHVFLIIAAIASLSFYFSLVGVHRDAVSAFYSPQTRFWELLAGSALAWLSRYKPQAIAPIQSKHGDLLSISGALLIAFGIYRLNSGMPFPGLWALLPVVGAVLLIAAGPNAWFNRIVLSNRVAVWIGLISFPLYLWHWPLLTFLRITEYDPPGRVARLAAVLLAVLLAWMTYRIIERPIRFGANSRFKTVALFGAAIIVGAIGFDAYRGGGLNARAGEKDAFVSQFENTYPTWRYFTEHNLTKEWRSECAFFDRARYMAEGTLEGGVANSKPVERLSPECYQRDPKFAHAVLIWGDSHAQVLSTGIVNNVPAAWQVLQVASAGCAPNPNISAPSATSQCDQSNYFAMKTVETAKPDVVVVAQATGHSVKSMAMIADRLRAAGVKRILFIGPSPVWITSLPKVVARYLWDTKPDRTFIGLNQDRLVANARLLTEFKFIEQSEYIDLIGLFCDQSGCLTRLGEDPAKTITSWDPEHLTPHASDYLAKQLLIAMIVGS